MTSESTFFAPVYKPWTVAASVLLAMLASYVALDLPSVSGLPMSPSRRAG
jgi:NO-binding membrane sensor protein with MHYT domain